MAKKPVIHLHNLTKNFGPHIVVEKLNLEVFEGEIFGFLGPNGAGKTTTIRMMLGQISPHDGTATIMGHDAWRDRAKVHAGIGYLGGDMALDAELTGKQYLQFLARLRGGVSHHLIHDLARKFDCDLSVKIRKLSRGNRQKVALISALMHDPELLILDEPTSGFDPLIQAEFNKVILDYKKRGKTVFISSHILSEIQHLCDRVAFIRNGSLVTVGKMQDLTESTLKRVRVVFASEEDVSHIRAVRGVHQVTADGRHAVFAFSGHMQDLLAKLADLSVVDLAIQDADLEELFMRYYKGSR